jgi:tetratricopeptide (TPR) repeat protein
MPYEEAVEKFKEVLKLDLDNVQIWASWGVALVELKQFEEAAEKFQKAVELLPNFVPALYGWGLALKAQGKEEEAAEKFQKAAEIDTAPQDLPKSEYTERPV